MHFICGVFVFLPIFMRVITLRCVEGGEKKQTLPRLISFLCLIRMIHSSLHIENLLKTNNAAKIAAQEIRKTNTRGTWESGWAGLNPTACCILPIFGSSCLFTATRKTNSTFYDITKGCTAFRASVWTLCFFLLFVCFSSMCLHVWLHSCSKRLPGFRVQRSGAAHFICTADAANQSQAFFICSESVFFFFFLRLQVKAGSSELFPRPTITPCCFAKRESWPRTFKTDCASRLSSSLQQLIGTEPFPAKAINKGGPGSCRSQSREHSLLKQGAQILI